MNEYLLYGYSSEKTIIYDNDGNSLDNGNIIGFSEGETHKEAIENFVAENEWIDKYYQSISVVEVQDIRNFNVSEIIE